MRIVRHVVRVGANARNSIRVGAELWAMVRNPIRVHNPKHSVFYWEGLGIGFRV